MAHNTGPRGSQSGCFWGPWHLGNVWKNERGIAPEVSDIRCSPAAAWTPLLEGRKRVQKSIARIVKPFLFPFSPFFDVLSRKAALQKIFLSKFEVKEVLGVASSISMHVAHVFLAFITNSLCTSHRIKSKNSEELYCFACRRGPDDLFHFVRCRHCQYLFGVPHAWPRFG